jgi:hypothetical protein
MERDLASVLDALIFSRKVVKFTQRMTKDEFKLDFKTQDAVMYNISVLGEAIRRISPEFSVIHPEIPYGKIIGMRNKLVHDYDGINLDLIWDVVQDNIPELITIFESIIPDEDSF